MRSPRGVPGARTRSVACSIATSVGALGWPFMSAITYA